jgi:activator of 2-hydroxyglutaryl-CoA dehydratase
VVASLEKRVGIKIKPMRKADPQLAGAIGAALTAAEKIKG